MNRQEIKLFEAFLREEGAYDKFLKTLKEDNGTELRQYYQETNKYIILTSAFRWGGYKKFTQESHDYWSDLNTKWKKLLNQEELGVWEEVTEESLSELVSKDIAYFVAFFYWGDYGFGSMFETFDKVYGMAVKFVEKYPPTLNWEDASWEEVAEQWIIDNYKNIKLH